MRSRRIAALGAAVAVAGLAALPAAGQARISPPPGCFETPQFAICTTDVGPLAGRAVSDPVGSGEWAAGVAAGIACYDVGCSVEA